MGSAEEAVGCAAAPFDLVLVAVRTIGLAGLVDEWRPFRERLMAPLGLVVTLLNGIEAVHALGEAFGREHVLGAIANVAVEEPAPGELLHQTGGELLMAPLVPDGASRAAAVAAFLRESGVQAQLRPDLPALLWRKPLWNSALNAVTALTGQTMAAAATTGALRELLEAAMREALAVARAEGVSLPEQLLEVLLRSGAQCGLARSSMQQDAGLGRATEHDALNGVICRLGRKHGIPTPVQDTLYRLLEGRVDS
jgi:2-dehydropantoate 2-reductase